jgi:hypothetical protein
MMQSGTKRGAKALLRSVHSYSPFSMALSQFCSFFCESVFFIVCHIVTVLAAPTIRLTGASKIQAENLGLIKRF